MLFEDSGQRALDTAKSRGADYADIRFENARTERIEVRNGVVATLADSTSTGYGIRALSDGAWGFAASSDLSSSGVDATAARAVAMARAAASIARRPIGAAPARAHVATFATPVSEDVASIPLGERVALLLDAEKLLHAGPQIAVGRAWIDLWTTDKYFFSTIGSKIEQRISQTGSGIQALAVGEGDAQTRSFPGAIGLY